MAEPLIRTDEPAPAARLPFDPDKPVMTRAGKYPTELRKLFDLHMRGKVDGTLHDWSQETGLLRHEAAESDLDLVNDADGVKAKT